jgi:hypothetical protein
MRLLITGLNTIHIKTIVNNFVKTFALSIGVLLLFGCAKSIEVVESFPEPVLVPLPLTVGVRYPTELTNFFHSEDPELSAKWNFKLGQANLKMFRILLDNMFTQTIELNVPATELQAEDSQSDTTVDSEATPNLPQTAIPNASAASATDMALDVILEPSLEELEFSTPLISGTDQFTIWLRYNIKIIAPDGELLRDWRITGYGQQDEGAMGLGDEEAMRRAAITALRDAAANIAVNFSSLPELQSLTTAETQLSETGNK